MDFCLGKPIKYPELDITSCHIKHQIFNAGLFYNYFSKGGSALLSLESNVVQAVVISKNVKKGALGAITPIFSKIET